VVAYKKWIKDGGNGNTENIGEELHRRIVMSVSLIAPFFLWWDEIVSWKGRKCSYFSYYTSKWNGIKSRRGHTKSGRGEV